MTCVHPATYEDVVRKAYWAEERLWRVKALHQQKRVSTASIDPTTSHGPAAAVPKIDGACRDPELRSLAWSHEEAVSHRFLR